MVVTPMTHNSWEKLITNFLWSNRWQNAPTCQCRVSIFDTKNFRSVTCAPWLVKYCARISTHSSFCFHRNHPTYDAAKTEFKHFFNACVSSRHFTLLRPTTHGAGSVYWSVITGVSSILRGTLLCSDVTFITVGFGDCDDLRGNVASEGFGCVWRVVSAMRRGLSSLH